MQTIDIDNYINSIVKPVDEIQAFEKMENLLNERKIIIESIPQQMPCLLYVRENMQSDRKIRMLTAGNISLITGKSKSKKTFLFSTLAATLSRDFHFGNILFPNMPLDCKRIIYIDTEQSKFDSWNVLNRIKQLHGNVDYYSLRGISAIEIKEFINYLIKKFNDIAIIFIDQIADLLKSVNDEEDAKQTIKFLEKITAENNIHVSCLLHQNKANTNGMGWIGSILLQKCEICLTITKDSDDYTISHVEPTDSRGAMFDKFSFKINETGIPEIYINLYAGSKIIDI